MNYYLKTLSFLFVLTSCIYLPNGHAASSTDMLITIAESNPILLDRLNEIRINDPILLKHVIALSNSDPAQLERLLNLAETDLASFVMLAKISNAEEEQDEGGSSMLGIEDGGIIQN
ncbi:MAG: hypothetical protein OQK09_09225 [Colwellia sp.]|nr:hypothetical protein [Colwellia sp.]MCW8863426.1 hypothetical protein [Colwellia sp.]MCW9081680.1 hypothetical protein [Colwellia sp.]